MTQWASEQMPLTPYNLRNYAVEKYQRVEFYRSGSTALRKIQKSMKITNRKDPEEEPSYHRVEKIPECRGAVSHQVQSMK